MPSSKVVIISAVIFPRISPRAMRATELAKEFARKGFDVTLYAVLGNYDYTDFEISYGIKVKNLGSPKFYNVTSDNTTTNVTLLFRLCVKLFKNILDFPNIELSFLTNRALKNEKHKDMLITIAMPHAIHWGAAYRKLKNRKMFPKIWVADCGDPFMGNKFHNPAFYFKYIEKWFCKKADYITIPINSAIEAYYKEFHEKIRVIPQGFDLTQPITPIQKSESGDTKTTTFIYAGTLYTNVRDPKSLLEYLSTRKDIDFRFIVYTSSKNFLKGFQDKLGDKLVVNDFIPRSKLLSVMLNADFLINFENNNQIQSPSKLIDYKLVNKPILSINSSDELNIKLVEEFLSRDYSNSYKFGSIERYDIKNVTDQFIALM